MLLVTFAPARPLRGGVARPKGEGPAEERVEVSRAGADGLLSAGRATATRPLPGGSVNLCLRVDRLAGRGISVSSYFLRNPLPAEEPVAWTGIAVDQPIRLQTAA
jgi:hypothetical protein